MLSLEWCGKDSLSVSEIVGFVIRVGALPSWLLLLPTAGVLSRVKVPVPVASPAAQVAVLESRTSSLKVD